jgi:hypothetical protein
MLLYAGLATLSAPYERNKRARSPIGREISLASVGSFNRTERSVTLMDPVAWLAFQSPQYGVNRDGTDAAS